MSEDITIEPLLITKLKMPRLYSDLLPRQRLIDDMQQQSHGKVTLITAPAGFGKTTLTYSWIQHHKSSVAWFSIDQNDNDPKRFWTYFVSALQTIDASIGIGAKQSLISPTAPQDIGLTILINELAEYDQEIVLVLDDYHEIELSEIDDGMSFLIDNMPPQLNLIISSRAEPNLPLARLRARRQLFEITAVDLRFTEDETKAFFQNLIGLELTDKHISALSQRTEGWIAGLQMAAVSMRNNEDLDSFIEAFTGSHRHILDYLVEEVLEQQSDTIQQFLLQTSILDSLSASLCEAVAQIPDAQQILDDLSQRNLFIVSLDDERRWFRYHQLFAEFLRNRLEQNNAFSIVQLRSRAAVWFIKNGLIPEAIEQLIQAEHFEDAADLIEEHGTHIFWRYHEWVRLHNWLNSLPRPLIHGRPILCAAYGWVHLLTGKPEEMVFYVETAEQALSVEDDNDVIGEIMALKAEYAMITGDFDTAIDLASEALTYLSDDNIVIRSLGLQIQGYIYRNMGNVSKASSYLSEAHRTSLRGGDLMVGIFALSDLGNVKVLQGKLDEAIDIYDKIIRGDLGTHSSTPISAHIGLGNIYRERNQLEDAIESLHRGIELAEQYGISSLVRNGNIHLAYALLAHGDLEQAEQACDFAVNSAHRSGVERIIIQARAHQMNLRILMNKVTHAEEWIASRNLTAEEAVIYDRELELYVLAHLLVVQKEYTKAIDLLQRLIDNAQADGRFGNVIENLILITRAYDHLDDQKSALKYLAQAVELGVADQYIRVFLDGGRDIAMLLRVLATDSPYINYLSQLIEAFEATPPASVRIEGTLIEDLSERELDVLRLLAVGMSNREIAEQLIIGNSTVKTHTLNIYRKLNVNNRTHAVTRARNLSLI